MTSPALAPFRIRSFRFQWPSDLAMSWAMEMETLILGWYILTATGSVQQLVIFGALVWLGAILSPLLGLAADRLGARVMLCASRAIYALLAALLTGLTFAGALAPWHVFAITSIAGLLKPSDQALRNLLVAETMQPGQLLGALGLSRTTADMAKVGGALAGAGGVALIGMAPAYAVVTAVYVVSFVLALGVAPASHTAGKRAANVLADLQQGFRYAWAKPELLGPLLIAFLVNLLAFPFTIGLLPYVAREVYGVGQAELGHLAAAFAFGALVGSVALGAGRVPLRAARVMLCAAMLWFAALLILGALRSYAIGLALIFSAGLVQSFCLIPLAAVILRGSSPEMRGRVLGMRILGVWGLPLGTLAAGFATAHIGFAACITLFAGAGLVATASIAWRWRAALWERGAAANFHP